MSRKERPLTRRQALGYLGASALATFIGAAACVSKGAIEQKSTPEPVRTPTDKPVDPTKTVTAIPSPTQKPPLTETPTLAPTPEVGQMNNEYFYPLPDGSKIFAPSIAGCYQRVEDVEYTRMVDGKEQVEVHQRIKYYKKVTDKETGKEVEVWVADYLPNVTFEGKQTGGLVVRSVEALALLNTELATIPEQQDKWKVLLPVDPRGYDPNKTVEVYAGPAKTYTRNIIHVKFDGRLPLTNILPLAKEIVKGNHSAYKWGFNDNKLSIGSNYETLLPGEEMRYIRVVGSMEGLPDAAFPSKFGDQVGEINNHVYISFGSRNIKPVMTGDDVLSGDSRLVDSKNQTIEANIPIFVAANE
jgi:hypothetical protein